MHLGPFPSDPFHKQGTGADRGEPLEWSQSYLNVTGADRDTSVMTRTQAHTLLNRNPRARVPCSYPARPLLSNVDLPFKGKCCKNQQMDRRRRHRPPYLMNCASVKSNHLLRVIRSSETHVHFSIVWRILQPIYPHLIVVECGKNGLVGFSADFSNRRSSWAYTDGTPAGLILSGVKLERLDFLLCGIITTRDTWVWLW